MSSEAKATVIIILSIFIFLGACMPAWVSCEKHNNENAIKVQMYEECLDEGRDCSCFMEDTP